MKGPTTEAPRTLVCIAPGTLELKAQYIPEPGPGEVLIQIRRVGVCGTDFHIFEGKHPFLEYPRVMGHELGATVVAAPANSGLNEGERVVVNPYLSCGECHPCRRGAPNCCMNIQVLGVHCDGGLSGYLALPVQNTIPAPDLTLDQCASVEFLSIGAHAVRRSGLGSRDRVLVVGAGPIGLGTGFAARIQGAQVDWLDRDAERLKTAHRLNGGGETHLAEGDILTKVRDATDGNGYDVVFDATGSAQSIESSFAFVAHSGLLVLVSVVTGDITFSDPEFHKREMRVIGSRNATPEDFKQVLAAISAGDVDIDSLITHRSTPENALVDLPRWSANKTGLIKAIISL